MSGVKYTEHEATCKVHHFECQYAKGEHKRYKILIIRGAGHVNIAVFAPTKDIQNEIRNDVIDNQYPIFELIGEGEESSE